MFDSFPEPLNPGVVCCSSFAIHGDSDFLILQKVGPRKTGVLGSLIGVDNFRCAICLDSLFQYIDAPLLAHGIADSPTHDAAAVYIDKRRQVLKYSGHWDVGDVCAR